MVDRWSALFAWLSRYRRLNTVFDRKPDLFAAHVWIAIHHRTPARLAKIQRHSFSPARF